MIRRPRRSLPAALLALVLLAAAVLVALSCIQLLLHQNPLIPFDALAEYAANLRWNDPVSIAAGVVAAVLGLILLAAALLPGKPTVLPLSRRRAHHRRGQPPQPATRPHHHRRRRGRGQLRCRPGKAPSHRRHRAHPCRRHLRHARESASPARRASHRHRPCQPPPTADPGLS